MGGRGDKDQISLPGYSVGTGEDTGWRGKTYVLAQVSCTGTSWEESPWAAGSIGLKYRRQIQERAVSKITLKGIPVYVTRKIKIATQVSDEAKTWRKYFVNRFKNVFILERSFRWPVEKRHQPRKSQARTPWGQGFGDTSWPEADNLGWGQGYRNRTID